MFHATLVRATKAALVMWLTFLSANEVKAGVITAIDVGNFSVSFGGDGWVPGEKIKINIRNPDGSVVDAGTVTADALGHIDESWLQGPSQLIEKGDEVFGVGSLETSPDFTAGDAAIIPLDFQLPRQNNFGPLHIVLSDTELPDAGFIPGSVNLTGTSANASIVSQTTSYDLTSDTITTDGIFNFSAYGPLLFTYQATGSFSKAVDRVTGDPLTGVQSVATTVRIGSVVPEGNSLTLFLVGALVLLGYGLHRAESK